MLLCADARRRQAARRPAARTQNLRATQTASTRTLLCTPSPHTVLVCGVRYMRMHCCPSPITGPSPRIALFGFLACACWREVAWKCAHVWLSQVELRSSKQVIVSRYGRFSVFSLQPDSAYTAACLLRTRTRTRPSAAPSRKLSFAVSHVQKY